MTEKRFIIIGDENLEFIMQDKLLLPIYDGKKRLSLKECCDLLNELNDKCEFLEIDNDALEYGAKKYAELYHKTLKENEQLKQQIKQLDKNIVTKLDIIQGDVE